MEDSSEEKTPKNKALCVLHSWLKSMGTDIRFPKEGETGDLICNGHIIRLSVVTDKREKKATLPLPEDLVAGEAFCHRCGKRSVNVGEEFGFRNMTKKSDRVNGKPDHILPQSQCCSCRGAVNNKTPQLTLQRKTGEFKRLDLLKLADSDPNVAIREIHRFTHSIGLGKPLKARVTDLVARMATNDYEGVSLRLTQFQKTVNPPDSIMRQYDPLIRQIANRMAFRYAGLCRRIGMDAGDLTTMGRVYFVNHWHLYAEKNEGGLNEKFLVNSLKQQFSRWYKVTWGLLRNVDDAGSGLSVDNYVGQPVAGGEASKNNLGEAIYSVPMEELLSGEEIVAAASVEMSDSAAQKVRKDIVTALESRLASMPHDRWVSTLKEVTENEFLAYDARQEAGRRLRKHADGCDSCKGATPTLGS